MRSFIAILFCLVGLTSQAAFVPNPATTNAVPPYISNTNGIGTNTLLYNGLEPATNFGNVPIDAAAVTARATNTLARGPYGFSANLMNLPFLQKALNATPAHTLSIVWFGDSTGNYTIGGFQTLLTSNYVYGCQPIVIGNGPAGYFDQPSGVFQVNTVLNDNNNWWGTIFTLSNTTPKQTFGIPISVPAHGNSLSFWYLATNTYGVVKVETSTAANSNSWTTLMTVDETTGPAGFRVTNASLTLGDYYVRVSATSLGTAGKVSYYWPQIKDSTVNKAVLYNFQGSGQYITNFTTMGTNSIAALLTNASPDVIVFEQTKNVGSLPYFTNFASYVRTYASNSDVVLIQAEASLDSEAIVDNGGQFQLPIFREIAITNGWAFLDFRSTFDNWTNTVFPQGFFNGDNIHLNTAGAQVQGQMAVKALGIMDMLAASGTLQTPLQPTNQFDPAQIAGLTFRYDPANTNLANGGLIKQFTDYSPNHYDCIASAGLEPYWTNNVNFINGRAWAEFTGGQVLQMSQPTHLTQPNTVYLVLNQKTSAGNFVFDSTNSTTAQRELMLDNDIFAGTDMGYTTEANVWKVYRLVFNNTASSALTNGISMTNGTAGTSTMDGLSLGCRYSQDQPTRGTFGLAYFLWYNAALTSAQDFQVMQWLNNRFSGYNYANTVTNAFVGTNDSRNMVHSGTTILGSTAVTNGGALPFISAATNTLVLGAPSMVILRSNAWAAINLTNSLNPGDGYMWNSNGSLYWISRGISGAANLKTNQVALGP